MDSQQIKFKTTTATKKACSKFSKTLIESKPVQLETLGLRIALFAIGAAS